MSMEQDKATVLAVYPDAYCGLSCNDRRCILTRLASPGKCADPIGRGSTKTEAWADARSRIEAVPEPKRHADDGICSPGVQKPEEAFDHVERWFDFRGENGGTKYCVNASDYDSLLSAYRARGERIKALENPWITVEERMPENGADILFNVPGCYGVEQGRFDSMRFVPDRTSSYNDEVSFDVEQVTHWMPLPAAPAKEGE